MPPLLRRVDALAFEAKLLRPVLLAVITFLVRGPRGLEGLGPQLCRRSAGTRLRLAQRRPNVFRMRRNPVR